jgi:hypothetical protein
VEEGEVSALDEYRQDPRKHHGVHNVIDAAVADAAVAELKAENDRLRVCGTCGHFINVEYEMCDIPNEFSVDPEYVGAQDPCRFGPPRWTPYWEADRG